MRLPLIESIFLNDKIEWPIFARDLNGVVGGSLARITCHVCRYAKYYYGTLNEANWKCFAVLDRSVSSLYERFRFFFNDFQLFTTSQKKVKLTGIILRTNKFKETISPNTIRPPTLKTKITSTKWIWNQKTINTAVFSAKPHCLNKNP